MITRHVENPRMSKLVVYNGTIYMSAQVADNPVDDFESQVEQVLRKIEEQLVSVGSDKSKMLSAVAYIDDWKKWGRFNAVWEPWVVQGHKPARTCVEAKLAFPEYQIEISVVAAV